MMLKQHLSVYISAASVTKHQSLHSFEGEKMFGVLNHYHFNSLQTFISNNFHPIFLAFLHSSCMDVPSAFL